MKNVAKRQIPKNMRWIDAVVETKTNQTSESKKTVNNLLEFLERLNKAIPPANEMHSLSPKHSVTLTDNTFIEVHLYPIRGGQYHIPIEVKNRPIDAIVSEIEQKYQKCLVISGLTS